METVECVTILLLKSAITGEISILPDDFDLEKVYVLLKKHNISALGYWGAQICGIDKNHPVMQKLFRDYYGSVIVNERQMNTVHKIFDAFEKQGISFLPVKGCIMKSLYPHPELRSMGDADILIHMEQYDEIRQIMLELGFAEGEKADHALVWESRTLEVELHRRLIPSTDSDYFAYYGDGWGKAAYAEGCHYYMTTEDTFLFIFTHFVKHFRSAGIGLRHLLDLWVYRRSYPEMDEAYLYQELDTLNLRAFYDNIVRLLDALFADGTMDPVLERLLEYIVNNGAWGNRNNLVLSDSAKKTEQSGSMAVGRIRWALSVIFMPYAELKNYYPILNRYAFLYPVYSVVRWFSVLFYRRNNIKKRIRNLKMLSDENITEYQKMLQDFGLHG